MCEELKEYVHYFNLFLFYVLGEDGSYKPKVRTVDTEELCRLK